MYFDTCNSKKNKIKNGQKIKEALKKEEKIAVSLLISFRQFKSKLPSMFFFFFFFLKKIH